MGHCPALQCAIQTGKETQESKYKMAQNYDTNEEGNGCENAALCLTISHQCSQVCQRRIAIKPEEIIRHLPELGVAHQVAVINTNRRE